MASAGSSYGRFPSDPECGAVDVSPALSRSHSLIPHPVFHSSLPRDHTLGNAGTPGSLLPAPSRDPGGSQDVQKRKLCKFWGFRVLFMWLEAFQGGNNHFPLKEQYSIFMGLNPIAWDLAGR